MRAGGRACRSWVHAYIPSPITLSCSGRACVHAHTIADHSVPSSISGWLLTHPVSLPTFHTLPSTASHPPIHPESSPHPLLLLSLPYYTHAYHTTPPPSPPDPKTSLHLPLPYTTHTHTHTASHITIPRSSLPYRHTHTASYPPLTTLYPSLALHTFTASHPPLHPGPGGGADRGARLRRRVRLRRPAVRFQTRQGAVCGVRVKGWTETSRHQSVARVLLHTHTRTNIITHTNTSITTAPSPTPWR